ncbi:ESX secretion-associated protein EspG [Natronosporangium hydrolyticum]|uniref:ESX secretion-associated protein EspG n=1 Tax=Natronosporangium hydrolyticum TaxID=2811111 RepID=A0A895YIT1_9ACTN|nr:ESX secretion-associated protein EspG [Natronosporangium hydrolyticum]QSB15439.1 ESX secretion-associated protein EspG [Natronosporangium hydrolyticum]
MTVSFDPVNGRLRLDDVSFAVLRDLVRQDSTEQLDGHHLAELRDSGVVRGCIPHPSLAYGLDAVAVPVCRLTLRVDTPETDVLRTRHVAGWLGRDAMAVLRDDDDGLREFRTQPVTLLPELVATETEFGPRPRPPELFFAVPADVWEELVTTVNGRAEREQAMLRFVDAAAEAGPAAADAARRLVTSLRRRWEVAVRWRPAPGAVGERSLQVVDAQVGLWRVTTGPGAVTLSATTPTVVWQEIIGLLPQDDELAAPESEPARAGSAAAGGGLESWQGEWSGRG